MSTVLLFPFMRLSLFLGFLFAAVAARAAVIDGDIVSVDAKASTVTVTGKAKPQTFRIRMDTMVTLNGAKADIGKLAPNMSVKVTANDPTVASKVEASSAPAAGPGGAPQKEVKFFGVKVLPGTTTNADGTPMDPLTSNLLESKWRMNDGKIFVLHGDGTTTGSWHAEKGGWKAVGEKTAQWTIVPHPKQADTVTFDADTKTATWKDELGQSMTAKRVTK